MMIENFQTIVQEAFMASKALIAAQSRYSHPFRDRFEHTKRVLRWAKEIQKVEGGDLEIITLAVIFHDVGWDDQRDHALVSAELAREFLLSQGLAEERIRRIESAVATHNKRPDTQSSLPLENQIVMDADLLDELGVTTLVWDAMSTALEGDPSFQKALERSQRFFATAKDKTPLLQTQTGQELYRERIDVWAQCLEQLRYELGENDVAAS